MSAFAKFYFRPAPGEKIHTVAAAREDEASGLFGRVTDGEKPLGGAFALLFVVEFVLGRRIEQSTKRP